MRENRKGGPKGGREKKINPSPQILNLREDLLIGLIR